MRSWQKWLLLAIAAVGLAVATVPYWLGAALPLLRRPLHLRARAYERDGYASFVLRDAVYQNGAVRVTARTVRVDTPVVWALRHWRGTSRPVVLGEWAVVVGRAPPTPPTGRPVGIVPLHALLRKIDAQLDRWLPRAHLGSGLVAWPTGRLTVTGADWKPDALELHGLRWAAGVAEAAVQFAPEKTIRIEAREADRAWRAALDWNGPSVSGTAWAWEQPLTVRADFDPQGWMPRQGEAQARNWDVPGANAGVGPLYSALSGSFAARYQRGEYSLRVHARASPARPNLPPLRVDLEAAGDAHGWSVQALQVESAYAHVQLTRPVRFRYGGRPDVNGAELDLRADLGRVPGLEATGEIAGHVALRAAAAALPAADFEFHATAAGWRKFPRGDLAVSGSYDTAQRRFSAVSVRGQWGGAALRALLPPGLTVASLTVEAHADGPLGALRHTGQVTIREAHVPPFRTGDIAADWSGDSLARVAFHLHGALERTLLDVSGTADRNQARITRLDFAPGGAEALRLSDPATIRWRPTFECDAVQLAGGGAKIGVDLRKLAFDFQLTRIPAAWVTAVITWNGPNFVAQSAAIRGRWEKGRLVFAARADAQVWLASGVARLTVAADGDGTALRIREARIESGGQVLASAAGEVPAWWSEEAPHLRFNEDAPLELRADTGADSPAWEALAETFGVLLQHPHALVLARGTLRHPVGEVHVQVGEMSAGAGRPMARVPSLRDFVLNLHADRSGVVLDRLTGEIAGRTIFASGRLPMSADQWAALFARTPGRPWERADATVEVSEAGLESMAAYLPALLAPRGRWSARLRLEHGSIEGTLHLRGLALRPLAPLGQIENISGDIECHDRNVDISRLTAEIGGQTLRLGGRVDLPVGGKPVFVVSLEGENIPLVRQSHLLVRSNLDLKATTVGEDTRLTGTVAVTDALLLGDMGDLLPSGVTGASRPPPYFSVEAPPFARWHADVQLSADHTLRVRTTLFSGDASAQFRILGQLSDPRAVGQLTVNQGQISLPFASFDVQVGSVRLDASDPFHPQVEVVATSRRYDYDLRMNATGTADAPVLTFTSNPALPSDQILQMVMAGQMPQTGSLLGAGQSQVAGLGEYVGQGLLSGLSGGPGSNRLSITSGQELSVKGKPTYEIEYRLAPRWWLVGEYDEFDAYNAGIRWRVYTKGGRP